MSVVSIPAVTAVLVLDQDGGRVAVKYFSPPPPLPPSPFASLTAQLAFEKRLFAKLHRSSTSASAASAAAAAASASSLSAGAAAAAAAAPSPASSSSPSSQPDILPFESQCVVYKSIADVSLYVVAAEGENELMVNNVLQSFDEALHALFKGQIARKTLIENLDLLLLTVDELLDNSAVLEVDAAVIVQRVCMITPSSAAGAAGAGGGGVGGGAELPISEQSFTQALQTARDQLVRSFR